MNQAILSGNLGKDPNIGKTANGKGYAKFSIATSRKWKDRDGEEQTSTEWHNIVCWGYSAEHAATLHKGDRVTCIGRIENRKYEKDGVDKYITEINCYDLSARPRTERAAGGGYGDAPPSGGEDVPF